MTKTYSYSLQPNTAEGMKKRAKKDKVSASNLVNRVLFNWLENMETVDYLASLKKPKRSAARKGR